MLHILLLLLKIIGIIILCILGTIILALLGILFVPVRYRIEVVRKEGENEPPIVVKAKVTWLLHFVNVLVRYSTEFYLRIRLLFIPVFRFPRKEKKKAGKRKKKEKGEETEQEREQDTKQKEEEREEKPEETEAKKEEREEKEKEERRKEEVEEGKERPEEAVEKKEKIAAEDRNENIEETSRQARDEKKEEGFVHKLRALWEKIRNFIENIQYTIRNICDKIKAIWNNIQYYSDLVKSDVFQSTFTLCKKELGRLLKGILPGTFEANLVVGTDDPAATGQILAVCGMLYPVLGGHIDVVGDFEQKRLEGRIFMKGRIYGITLLYVCVKIYFNENVKKLYRLLKKEAV